MFKYLRNLNHSAPPSELECYPYYCEEGSEDSDVVVPGMIVTLTSGEITTIFSANETKFFVVSVDKKNLTASCVRLFPGMVFEADIEPSVSADDFTNGHCYGIYTDDTAKGTHLSSSTEEPVFQLISISNDKVGKAIAVII